MKRKYHLLLVVALLGLVPALLAGTASAHTEPHDTGEPQVIHAKATDDHECNADEWHWVITQVDSSTDAPATITASFTDGVWVISLDAFTGHTAHYRLAVDSDYAPTGDYVGASTVIYGEWSGQFNLSHGPCEHHETTTTRPPTTTVPVTTIPATTLPPTTTAPPVTTVATTAPQTPSTTIATAVLPTVQTDPTVKATGQLPHTGANSAPMAGVAVSLIALGAWLSLARRRLVAR